MLTVSTLPIVTIVAGLAAATAKLNASSSVQTPNDASLCANYNYYITHAVVMNRTDGATVAYPPFYKVRSVDNCNLFNCGGNVVTRCGGQQICNPGRLKEVENVRFWCFKSSKEITLAVKTAPTYPKVSYQVSLTHDDFACSGDLCIATALDGTMVYIYQGSTYAVLPIWGGVPSADDAVTLNGELPVPCNSGGPVSFGWYSCYAA